MMINYVYFVVFIFILIQSQISSLEDRFVKEFRKDFVVPNLLPSLPAELSPIVYKPGLIILTGKPYFSYQIQGLPDITWDHKEETYYTIIILGAVQQQTENATKKDSRSFSKITVSPPAHWWHQWVKVNVFENSFDSTGTDLKPFVESNMLEPNKTHRILYAFGIYQQKEKIELNLDDKNNTADNNLCNTDVNIFAYRYFEGAKCNRSTTKFMSDMLQARNLLQRYFNPVSNFEKSFPGSILVAGNFFNVIEKFKLTGGIREDLFDPKALKLKKTVESARKDNYNYFF